MIEIAKIYKAGCPLCRSLSQRLFKMENEYKNLRVLDYKWDRLNDDEKEFYAGLGVTRVPFIIVLDFEKKVEPIKQSMIILTGFTPKKLKKQIEKLSGEKLELR